MKRPDEIVEDGNVWWFGESWGAPICDEDYHVETPVGRRCVYTGKTVSKHDRGFIVVSADDDTRVIVLFEPFIQQIARQFPNTPIPRLYSDANARLEDLINEEALAWVGDLLENEPS
jgi:hypothetical protein